MQVTLSLKPHNTDTKGIGLSVRITMSVQKEREEVLFIFLPLKGGGGGGLYREEGGLIEDIRYFSVPVIIHCTNSQHQFSDEHAHPFRIDLPYQFAFSPYLIPLESLLLFFLWLYHKGPLGVVA